MSDEEKRHTDSTMTSVFWTGVVLGFLVLPVGFAVALRVVAVVR